METFMDIKRIRDESIRTARQLGVDVLPTLPLLDADLEMRAADETVSRILVMHAVAATAYGFDKAKAISWLKQEALTSLLTPQERAWVFEGVGQPSRFQAQIEAMWALSWAMGVVSEIDFGKDCDKRFAAMLPNLKASESSSDFRKKANPRPLKAIVASCDLAYCLHWAITQSELSGKRPGNLKAYIVIERRRALEWLLSKEAWDQVPLDT
jgi:hypothetical protein